VRVFIRGLQAAGFDTGQTCTPIVPIMVGAESLALRMTQYCQEHGVFVLPVFRPLCILSPLVWAAASATTVQRLPSWITR
jgi:7-keto-8-aminopelargonate synthetase-like enzyme